MQLLDFLLFLASGVDRPRDPGLLPNLCFDLAGKSAIFLQEVTRIVLALT
jgi:hypothetical protein